MPIQSMNPATGKIEKEFSEYSDEQVAEALDKAHETYLNHRLTSFEERAAKMRKAASILRDRQDEFARIMVAEMGKTITAARSEAEKCASVCDYYADHAEKFLTGRSIETDHKKSYIRYLPIGPVLAVMPWNFPFWQVFRFAAPNLMAGNVGLLKHASNVPQCALAIQEIFEQAGFESGCFQSLLIGSDKVEQILKDKRVRGATLTGSEGAGRKVAETAGGHIMKSVLELGGSDPFIVMPSADIEKAVADGVKGRTINNGQSCIAAKRFLIHEDIYEDYKKRFVETLENMKIGDPMDDDTEMGPLVMKESREDLDEQVRKSIKAGAKRVTGAEIMEGNGFYYKPGILEDIPEDSPGACEEFFGPVALFYKVKSLDQAIDRANNVRFGLGSAIYTQDRQEMETAIRDLDYGSTFVNHIVASDPHLPFGGVKASGYGRELSEEGIKEFVNIKTVAID